ncbi:hypothetical protein [Mycolicibacterium sp. P1-5]|uniref:hypothetical protein n=1 Tax=Mycolicibacterium sp. P1-5 TaxID=2024617 RepID=UPI0011EC0DB0|nr:hypothetical protein [Mycolicibacterium sp. P1-5]KAA0106121.1 hypothetical protein CIW47_19025 [Mycolicibacterium sp. P1-5]
MGLLDASSGGLAQLATDCGSLGAAISGTTPSAALAGTGWQATVAAVNETNADAALAARAMVKRMHDMASDLTTAGAHYALNESESAGDLRALITGV